MGGSSAPMPVVLWDPTMFYSINLFNIYIRDGESVALKILLDYNSQHLWPLAMLAGIDGSWTPISRGPQVPISDLYEATDWVVALGEFGWGTISKLIIFSSTSLSIESGETDQCLDLVLGWMRIMKLRLNPCKSEVTCTSVLVFRLWECRLF